jgi:hypothetical protein
MKTNLPIFNSLTLKICFVIALILTVIAPHAVAQAPVGASSLANQITLVMNGPASVNVGETFSVTVEAQNVPQPGLYGVQFEIDYDPSMISVDNLQVDPAFSFVLIQEVDNVAGKIRVVASQQGQVPGLTGNVVLLTFDATAAATPCWVTFTFENVKFGDAEANPFHVNPKSYRVRVGNPTAEPTDEPTAEPTDEPTVTPEPTDEPTAEPTDEPTVTPEPTDEPTVTPEPTDEPTAEPTDEPTVTPEPTDEPTAEPTDEPTITPEPTDEPTAEPTDEPTVTPEPTDEPTAEPTDEPTAEPTDEPTVTPEPTDEPTAEPTDEPTVTPEPTDEPTVTPEPTDEPTVTPEPTTAPVSGQVILAGRANNDWSDAVVTVDDSGQNATTDAAGNYTIADVTTGLHSSISADATGYLAAVCANPNVISPETNLTAVALVSGDINDDDMIDVTDATAIGSSFGATGPDLEADINADEIIDIFDLILVSVNFGEVGPTTWVCQ